jgi:hypothetical protein
MLAIIIAMAKKDGQVGGLVPIKWMDECLFYSMAMIQLVYGTRLRECVNMKLILCIFVQLQSRVINFFNKAKYFVLKRQKGWRSSTNKSLVVKLDRFAFWYLGIPIQYKRFLNKERNPIETRF